MTRQTRPRPTSPARLIFGALAAIALSLALATPLLAQETDTANAETNGPAPMLEIRGTEQQMLDDFRWKNRLVIVFADTPADPRFNEQIELLTARPTELIARDVIVLTDTDPDARSPIRIKLRPRGFQVTLIGKDGEVELRKPSPWSSRELSRSIDKMPLRKQEIREQKAAAG